ncbi:MAG TPA: rhodanese-like domain-containing protein [Thermoleophilaceae bacterium]|nr:rhodanese-like domain-containing protein [Thermoleophilaceae bacterium]
MSELSPQEVAEMLNERNDVQLVDVRRRDEHEAGRIAGSRHIELELLPAEAGSLDRDRPIVFYCRSGNRSELAAQAFGAAGFEAHNLGGGLLAWRDAGLTFDGGVA